MVAFVFFGAIFSSVVWLIYAFRFVNSALSGMALADAGILNVLLYVLFICLPLLLIWFVFGFVNQYLYNRMTSRQLFKLFSQMKKNQDYSDLLARIMLETEQNIKDSFVLGRFELLIADMNELLSEFLQRTRLISSEQTEHLWTKVQNGGKWSFGKVLIENYNRHPSFQKKIFDDAGDDQLLAGTIMEFCARYQTLLGILEKHDKECVLSGIIETGVFGKVFAILAPIADGLQRTKDVFVSNEKNTQPLFHNNTQPDVDNNQPEPSFKKTEPLSGALGNKINSFLEKFKSDKSTTQTETSLDKDAFSLALERSFGETIPVKEEPVFETGETVSSENKGEVSFNLPPSEEDETTKTMQQASQQSTELGTQKTLDSLKKEWKKMDNTTVVQDEEDLTYPFGGWTDAENYQK